MKHQRQPKSYGETSALSPMRFNTQDLPSSQEKLCLLLLTRAMPNSFLFKSNYLILLSLKKKMAPQFLYVKFCYICSKWLSKDCKFFQIEQVLHFNIDAV